MDGQIELFENNNPLLGRSAVTNPAFLPQKGLHISLNTRTHFSPGGAQLFNVFDSKKTAEESIRDWFKDSSLNFKNIELDQELNLLEIGIRSRRSYIHMSSKIVARTDLNLDKDLFGLFFLGNLDSNYYNKTAKVDLSGTQFQLQSEHRMSYGRRIGSKLYIGASAKVIHGLARLKLNNANLDVTTDTSLNSIYALQVNGDIDAISTGFQGSLLNPYDPFSYLFNIPFVNYGLAFGGGLIYRPVDFLRLSVATENQGYTEWNYFGSTHKVKVGIDEFTGFDTIGVLSFQNNRNLGQDLQDTISTWYGIYENDTFYKDNNTLLPRYNLSIEFLGLPQNRIAFIYASGMGSRSNQELWAISDQVTINKYIQLYGSYARILRPKTENVINIGFSSQFMGLQLFGQLNNVSAIINPERSANFYSGQLGIAFNFTQNFDSDGDDIPDHRDNCRNTYGVPRYRGCPKHMFRTPHIIDPKTKRLKPIRRVEERFK